MLVHFCIEVGIYYIANREYNIIYIIRMWLSSREEGMSRREHAVHASLATTVVT